MLKQGTHFALAVDFTGLDLDKAERIEFIFRRGPTNASPLIKRCSWPGEAQREEGGSGTFTLNGSQWVSVTSGSSSYSECGAVCIYRV